MMNENKLREILRSEGDSWSPRADAEALASRMLEGSRAGVLDLNTEAIRAGSSQRRRNHARRGSGSLSGFRPFSIAAMVVLLAALGGGVWVATLGVAHDSHRDRPAATTSVATTPGSSVPPTTASPSTSTSVPPSTVVRPPAGSLAFVLSNDPATAPTSLPSGSTLPRQAVPWSSVGPSWTLFTYADIRCACGSTARGSVTQVTPGYDGLFLVDPSGQRYLIAHWKVGAYDMWNVVAWSATQERVILAGANTMGARALYSTIEMNLVTGSATPIGARDVIGFAPNGVDLVSASANIDGINEVRLVAPSGATLSVLDQGQGVYDLLVKGGIVVGSEGQGMHYISWGGGETTLAPLSQTCSPDRPWNAANVLASCGVTTSGSPILWIVPLDGSPAHQLVLPAAKVIGPPGSPWNGSTSQPLEVYGLPNGTYVTDAGACAVKFVGKQVGSVVTQLVPPGVSPAANMQIVGSVGSDLVVDVASGCTEPSRVLALDTVTNTWTTLFESQAGMRMPDVTLFPDFTG